MVALHAELRSPTAGLTAATPRPIAPSGPSNRLYLVLAGIVAAPDDNSNYNVFLDLPEGQGNPPTSDPHYVGTLNFFNAAGHEELAPPDTRRRSTRPTR